MRSTFFILLTSLTVFINCGGSPVDLPQEMMNCIRDLIPVYVRWEKYIDECGVMDLDPKYEKTPEHACLFRKIDADKESVAVQANCRSVESSLTSNQYELGMKLLQEELSKKLGRPSR